MSALAPPLDAALAGPAPTIFGAVLLQFPSATVALLSGSAVLAFGGRTYTGRDATFGTLGSIENLSEGLSNEAPSVGLTLYPANDAAAAALADPAMQGSPVTITLGAVDPATGAIIGTHVLFVGEVDVPTINLRANERTVDYEVVSSFERFFSDDEGIRLSPDWHKTVWAGETGLDDVTGVTQPIYWGVEGPRGGIVYGGGGGAGSALREGIVNAIS